MKSLKKSIKKPARIWGWLTFVWISYPILIIINLVVLFFVTLSFYGNIVGAQDYVSIYDWDYPSEGKRDFNNDGIEDRITSGGCANFGPQSARPPLMCDPYYLPESKVIERGGKHPYHSYMVKENGNWFILVLDKNTELKKYLISDDKQISLVTPTTRDYINEAIYYIPVLTITYLLSPAAFLYQIIERGVIALYLVVLLVFIYKWQKL